MPTLPSPADIRDGRFANWSEPEGFSFLASDGARVALRDHGLHVGELLAMHRLDDPALDVRCDLLVEPGVLPGRVGDEVSGPAVRESLWRLGWPVTGQRSARLMR